MYKIALIGAGQLGSRHLQALSLLDFEATIEVVEPFEGSQTTAYERYCEVADDNYKKELIFFKTISELSENLDFVIVATNADVRFDVTKELLTSKKVKYLILEKVLFQKLEHYQEMDKLLDASNVRCWVNHPRRMFPFYDELKKELNGSKYIHYTYDGGDWGLGCNGLHFIDHLSFLSDQTKLSIETLYLDDEIYSTKRQGFVEFYGELKGNIGPNTFSLRSDVDFRPGMLMISSDKLVCIIDESNGYVKISKSVSNWEWEEISTKIIFYQSELSHLVAMQLLDNGSCNLPTYQEAMDIHTLFISALLEKMENIEGSRQTVCPIT